MNEVIKAIEGRRSVRHFLDDPAPDMLIDQICEAGTYAASGMGKQSPIIIAVKDRAVRDKLSRMNAKVLGASEDMDPFYGAPVVLVVLADKSVPTAVYDGSLVMGNMMLAAHSLGVSSCWIHRAKEMFEGEEGMEILKELKISGDYEGIGNLVIGYTHDEPKPPAKRKAGYVYHINP